MLATTATLAQDRAWLGDAEKRIGEGTPAAQAVGSGASSKIAAMFTQLGGMMAERVTDLRDVRDRVIADLSGLPEPGVPVPDVPSILCAEDLAPVDTAGLDASLVVALATTLGGPTSHTAIIARQLGIPCVVAVDGLDAVPAGVTVMVDGTLGTVTVEPDAGAAAKAVERGAARGRSRQGAGPVRVPPPTVTSSRSSPTSRTVPPPGRHAQTPAEGVGLFRTELCFLNRDTEPTVDEQAQIYGDVLEAFDGHKVVIRTLDAGSDKPLKFVGPSGGGQPGDGGARHPHRRRQPGHPDPPARGDRRGGATDGQCALGDGADDRHPRRSGSLCRADPFVSASPPA